MRFGLEILHIIQSIKPFGTTLGVRLYRQNISKAFLVSKFKLKRKS